MVKIRAERIENIALHIPDQTIDAGKDKGKVVVLGWGSTYGTIKAAVQELLDDDMEVSHVHIRYLNPFPKNLQSILNRFDKVLIPEINMGQLIKLIRERFLIDAVGFNKIKGLPFTVREMKQKIREVWTS